MFFRDSVRRRADAAGVVGWIRNNPDGTVEAALEGELEAVEALVAFCREGPRGAVVEHVDISEEEVRGEAGFAIF